MEIIRHNSAGVIVYKSTIDSQAADTGTRVIMVACNSFFFFLELDVSL